MLKEILNKNLSLNWSYDNNKVEFPDSAFLENSSMLCMAHVFTEDTLLEVFQLGSFWYNGYMNGVQVVSGLTLFETQKSLTVHYEHIKSYKERGFVL